MDASIFYDDAIMCCADLRDIIPTYQLPAVLMTAVQLCLCLLYRLESHGIKMSIFCDGAIVCYDDWTEIIWTRQLPTVLMPAVQL